MRHYVTILLGLTMILNFGCETTNTVWEKTKDVSSTAWEGTKKVGGAVVEGTSNVISSITSDDDEKNNATDNPQTTNNTSTQNNNTASTQNNNTTVASNKSMKSFPFPGKNNNKSKSNPLLDLGKEALKKKVKAELFKLLGPHADALISAVNGPDSKFIPIDVVQNTSNGTKTPLLIKTNVNLVNLNINKEKSRYHIALKNPHKYCIPQKKDYWCWAACIRSLESFIDQSNNRQQEQIVRRIYDPEVNKPANSYQMLKALHPDLAKQTDEFKYLATHAAFLELADSKDKNTYYYLKIAEMLDFYMGTQEVIRSIAEGQPVLAGLKSEQAGLLDMGHMHLITGVEFIEIAPEQSQELAIRKLHTILKNRLVFDYLKQSKVNQKSDDIDYQKLALEIDQLKKTLQLLDEAPDHPLYAITKVHIFDPWKWDEKDNELKPEKYTKLHFPINGLDFKKRLRFVINREHAKKAFEIAKNKQP